MIQPGKDAIVFASSRLEEDAGDAWQQMIYARLMMRSGDDSQARERWEAALTGANDNAAGLAARVVREGDWVSCRPTLIKAVRQTNGARRAALVANLVHWDMESKSGSRVDEILTILEDLADPMHLRSIKAIRDGSSGDARKRAEALISTIERQ